MFAVANVDGCRGGVIKSLLLREKVAAVRLTDEEFLLLGTPHPPPSRAPQKLDKLVSGNPVAVPLPPPGKAFCIP